MYANDAYIYDFGKQKKERQLSEENSIRRSLTKMELNRKKDYIWFGFVVNIFVIHFLANGVQFIIRKKMQRRKKGDPIFEPSIGERVPNIPILLYIRLRNSFFLYSSCISLSQLTILFRHHANRRSFSSIQHSVLFFFVRVFSLKKQKTMNKPKEG